MKSNSTYLITGVSRKQSSAYQEILSSPASKFTQLELFGCRSFAGILCLVRTSVAIPWQKLVVAARRQGQTSTSQNTAVTKKVIVLPKFCFHMHQIVLLRWSKNPSIVFDQGKKPHSFSFLFEKFTGLAETYRMLELELELELEIYISALVSLYINTSVVVNYNTRCSYFPLISALIKGK